jgi:hypothetical protein
VNAILAALAVSGLIQRFHVQFHRPLQGMLQRLADEIGVCPLLGELG